MPQQPILRPRAVIHFGDQLRLHPKDLLPFHGIRHLPEGRLLFSDGIQRSANGHERAVAEPGPHPARIGETTPIQVGEQQAPEPPPRPSHVCEPHHNEFVRLRELEFQP